MTSRGAKLAINQEAAAPNSKQKHAFTFQIVHAQVQPSQKEMRPQSTSTKGSRLGLKLVDPPRKVSNLLSPPGVATTRSSKMSEQRSGSP